MGMIARVGTWDASGGVYPTDPTMGDYWVISVNGIMTYEGTPISYYVNDWALWTGTEWERVNNQGIPSGVIYKGVWDASVEANYPPAPATGDYYVISGAGSLNGDSFHIGDWIVYNGTSWDKIDNTTEGDILNGAYPTDWNADTTHAASRNAIYDEIETHKATLSAHHIRYSNAEAVNAMGILGDANPLNHTKYTDTNARAAVVLDGVYPTDWNADGNHAASRNALYDKIDAMDSLITANTTVAEVNAIVATHTAIATAHQDAPALIATHAGNVSAHHARYTDAEVSALIATHAAIAAAHHAKYTDAEARGAINGIIGSDGHVDNVFDFDGNYITDTTGMRFRDNVNCFIEMDDSITTDHRYHGITLAITTNGGSFGSAMYSDTTNNRVSVADADQSTTMPCIGVFLSSNLILTFGVIRDNTWAFSVGKQVFVSTSGTFTTTAPSGSGDQVQAVGVSITADIMLFNPSMDISEVL